MIVGAGLGGTATAVRLLRFAREPVEIVLLERTAEYRNAGVAYHPAGNPWCHVFNIQAGRMSMFREDVDDFVTWANHEADRSAWPPEWREVPFTDSGPAPRRVYPGYLASRLAEAAREAFPGVSLVEAAGEAVDISADRSRACVAVRNFSASGRSGRAESAVLEADHVILATGLEPKRLPFAGDVEEHPQFVRHPYSAAGLERIRNVGNVATVAIVGILLSAYDSAAFLLRGGHRGRIVMIAPSELALRTYPPDHRHRVLRLPPPQLHGSAYEGREEFIRRLKAEWEKACTTAAEEYPDVSPMVLPEWVAKSWEPHLVDVLERVPTAELRELLRRHASLLATLRVGAVAYTTGVVNAAITGSGQVEIVVGRVDGVRVGKAGRLVVSIAAGTTPRFVEADLVIANFGREVDYERVGSPLWTNLLRSGVACSHRRTGRGVEVDGAGRLLRPDGGSSGRIWVVGAPREGDEIVRNGRLGAFAFNLAVIKNHSVAVAAAVLRALEDCYRAPSDGVSGTAALPEGSPPSLRDGFHRCVMLDVRRMAARRRLDRTALTAELEHALQLVRSLMEAGRGSRRALRGAVNEAATERLTDLSVTPRDLRSLLGLDDATR